MFHFLKNINLQLHTKNLNDIIYSSWDIECDRLKLVINGQNEKKLLDITSFYTCVPKTTIIWGTLPEIRSETDRLVCQFAPVFVLLPPHDP